MESGLYQTLNRKLHTLTPCTVVKSPILVVSRNLLLQKLALPFPGGLVLLVPRYRLLVEGDSSNAWAVGPPTVVSDPQE
jgi:hypothetical protein